MYSIKMYTGEQKATAKGVSYQYQKKFIRHRDYKRVLFEGSTTQATQIRIASMNHFNYTVKTNKVGLSCFNDKRYIRKNFRSYAFGHVDIV